MCKVSILVPVYNVERFLERCTRSLFEQTYDNLEFIFVDDCTPDGSMALLSRVLGCYPEREKDVRIVNHKKNQGLAAARNTGLRNSSGVFIICVDSDDWLESDAIECLVNEQLKNNADIVTGAYVVHNHNGEQQVRQSSIFDEKEKIVLQMMQRTWDHFVAGRLVRRSLFIDNGLQWQDGLDVAEDRYMMTLLVYYANTFASVRNNVYHYERGNTNSLTKAIEGKVVLRNNNQELGNVLLLEQFFQDKESVYQKACSKIVMEQLEYNLQAAVTHSNKEEFYRIAAIIRGRDDADLKLIGWKRNDVRDWVKHHYCHMVLAHQRKRAISAIKKRIKSLIC